MIADFDICEKMLRYFIQRVHPRRWSRPRMVICVPSGITGVEQRAVQEAAESAGARKPAHIIEEPMAAAIGAGLPVHEPAGNMIVDIGGGTTEVAVISLGGIVASESIRIAGDELDEAIVNYVKKEYSLALGERTAEEIKIALGSACPLQEELYAEVRGRDLVTGLPKTIVVSTREIREAIEEPVTAIVDAVKVTLDKTPPELAADIMTKGIVITGGGALLHGLRERLSGETGMPIIIADNPLLLRRARLGHVPRELQGPQGHGRHAGAVSSPSAEDLMIGYRRANRRYVLLAARPHGDHADHARQPARAAGCARRRRRAPRTRWSRPSNARSNAVASPVADWFDGVTNGGSLKRENRAPARRSRPAASTAAATPKTALEQNETLPALLDLPVLADVPRVTARVVNRSPGELRVDGRRSNKGEESRASRPTCRCSAPTASSAACSTSWNGGSKVLLLDDPESDVGVRVLAGTVERCRAKASRARDELRVDLDANAPVNVGDNVVTSGLENSGFPEGLVGRPGRRSRTTARRSRHGRARRSRGRTSMRLSTSRCCGGSRVRDRSMTTTTTTTTTVGHDASRRRTRHRRRATSDARPGGSRSSSCSSSSCR